MPIKRISLILISLILAICLTIVPLPDWANWLRPTSVTLVLCYWILRYPHYINVGIGWFIGLLLDALYGTILGEHALAMTLVAYLMVRSQRILKHYPAWQQSVFIVFYSFIYNFVLFIIQWSLGQTIAHWQFWISPLLVFALWPLLHSLLNKVQIKFRIL